MNTTDTENQSTTHEHVEENVKDVNEFLTSENDTENFKTNVEEDVNEFLSTEHDKENDKFSIYFCRKLYLILAFQISIFFVFHVFMMSIDKYQVYYNMSDYVHSRYMYISSILILYFIGIDIDEKTLTLKAVLISINMTLFVHNILTNVSIITTIDVK